MTLRCIDLSTREAKKRKVSLIAYISGTMFCYYVPVFEVLEAVYTHITNYHRYVRP